jgi:hypothetical protein
MVRDARGTYQVGRGRRGLGTSARQADKGNLPPGQGDHRAAAVHRRR